MFLHRGTVGEWDFDLLATFDADELLSWGFKEFELGMVDLDSIEFPEYDESVADEVEWNECPECGHRWPK